MKVTSVLYGWCVVQLHTLPLPVATLSAWCMNAD